MRKIICVGGATIDYKLKSLQVLQQGSSNPANSLQTFGGVACNIASNAAQLTTDVHVQCLIGDDTEGKQLLTVLQKKHINTQYSLQLDGQCTGRYYAILEPNGELHLALADMEIYEHIPASDFTKHWQHFFKDNIVLLDTNLSSDLITHAIQLRNTPFLCIDAVSVTKSAKLPKDLHGVYLLKVDRHEASALAQLVIHTIDDCYAVAKLLLQRGLENCVITLGKDGYVLATPNTIKHFNAIHIEHVVDVSGAGDAFFAGILTGLQQNFTLNEACQLGNFAAFYTLQSSKTVADDFTFNDLTNLLAQQKRD